MRETKESRSGRKRDRSRTYDVVLWGATGFTGTLVAEYLVNRYGDTDLRLALAGRNQSRLERVRDELVKTTRHPKRASALPLLVGDSYDVASLEKIVKEAEVVCSTVGPYAKYGSALVASCVEHGTDYCDLTGEVQFIRRMIDAHHERAESTGARIVHCCGFDSIPSDLGTFLLHRSLRDQLDSQLTAVKMFAGESRGGFSGGTTASFLHLLEEAQEDPAIRQLLVDPYSLCPDGARHGPDGADQRSVRYDSDLEMWTGPFLMAGINTRVVRRSNALLDYPYGRSFRYSEAMSFGSGPKGALLSGAVTAGLGGMLAAAMLPRARGLMQRWVLPKPGEGPSREQRQRGYFVMRLLAKGEDRQGNVVTARARVAGDQDPGYGETAKMLAESALCLALQGEQIECGGGIRTPASTMGALLIERLQQASMVFSVDFQ
ncbi:MAG: saccharopine dehydrogenase NADP-binding domain-containing protein [Myxococcota bacterium]